MEKEKQQGIFKNSFFWRFTFTSVKKKQFLKPRLKPAFMHQRISIDIIDKHVINWDFRTLMWHMLKKISTCTCILLREHVGPLSSLSKNYGDSSVITF